MMWYYVFLKSLREQVRDYWILILTLVFAPMFVFLYYLMSETDKPAYSIVFVNLDNSEIVETHPMNLGDTLIDFLQVYAGTENDVLLKYKKIGSRDEGLELLRSEKADVMIVLPANLTEELTDPGLAGENKAVLELVGDITDLNYIIGAIWTEELVNRFMLESAGINMPFTWKETTLGHSGQRSEFELYIPGLIIFSIIMMMFTASASIVREPEAGTLERLKISNLTAVQYLSGISLIQVIIGIASLMLTLGVAVLLGYNLIPGTFGFILLIGFLTSLSMISFSLIVAAACRSIKDVAVIGTFPLMLLMFFSGSFFPLDGGRILSVGKYTLHLNDLLSPTWAVDALNKVLIKGMETADAFQEIIAILILTIAYFIIGVWAFRKRHMGIV